MRREFWVAAIALLAAAGLALAQAACDDDTRGDSSDGDGDSDGDSDSDSDADECADYRTVYPEGPYGTAVGEIFQDATGLVDGDGVTRNFEELFNDTSVVAIAIVNAFDT